MKIANINYDQKILINKKLSKIYSKKSYLSKIPKCLHSKIIPIDLPNNKNFSDKNNNILLKNKIIKNYSSTQAASSENEKIPSINPQKDFQLSGKNSFPSTNIYSNKSQKIKRKIHSFEKESNSIHHNLSKISNHSKNSNDLNIKTNFENLKEEIYYYLDNDSIDCDYYNSPDKIIILNHKNTILKEKLKKLKNILNLTNKYKLNNKKCNCKIDNSIEKINPKELLKFYIEKYNDLNKRLQEINNENYIQGIRQQITTIQQKINFYEKGNQSLNKINNDRCRTLSNSNIKNTSHINNKRDSFPKNLNTNFKKTMTHFRNIQNDVDNQIKNKLIEYNNLLNEEILLSKKISTNDLLSKNIDQQLSELKLEFCYLLKISKNIPEISEIIKEKLNINDNFMENSEIYVNKIFSHQQKIINLLLKKKKEQQDLLNSKKVELAQYLEKLEKIQVIENNEICNLTNMNSNSGENNFNNNININSKRGSFKINEDTRKHFILSLKNKKKDIPVSKLTKNVSNNALSKEIILQNLSMREKEEKYLINIRETKYFSFNKNRFKHIKIKPNFSFVNERKDLLSENTRMNLQFSSIQKEKNEEINEDINVESSHSNNKNVNIKLIPYNKKKVNYNYRNNFDSDNNCTDEENNSRNKNQKNYSINTDQREKVLNTILYSDVMDYNDLRDINDLINI